MRGTGSENSFTWHWTPSPPLCRVEAVSETLIVQGRCLGPSELEQIRQWRAAHADWSRRRLSRELAAQWSWRNEAGQLKDMAARTLLVKLERRGLIELPPRRRVPPNRMRCQAGRMACPVWDQRSIECGLAELRTLRLEEVSGIAAGRGWVAAALRQFHYLGFGGPVGQNLQYVVRDRSERPLAAVVFGAAAWKCQDRDRFLGWSAQQRQRNLGLIANNCRFLILPWAKAPHLASWILGQIHRRIAVDWQAKYGHGVVVLETFVERARFSGTVYRAANWLRVGATAGRTRQDRHTCIQAPVKDIYLYPLRRSFREALAA